MRARVVKASALRDGQPWPRLRETLADGRKRVRLCKDVARVVQALADVGRPVLADEILTALADKLRAPE